MRTGIVGVLLIIVSWSWHWHDTLDTPTVDTLATAVATCDHNGGMWNYYDMRCEGVDK